MWKKFLLISLILFGSYGINRIYFKATDGFRVSKIRPPFQLEERWKVRECTENEKIKIDEILNQTFTYLGKGHQSYVFQSEDQHYVIKFPKFQKYKIPFCLDKLVFLPPLKSYLFQKIEKRQKKLDYFLNSWKTAFNELNPECQVLYVQINPLHTFQKNICIIDKIGIKREIPLSQMTFMLQRKGQLLDEVIDEAMSAGRVNDAKEILDKLIHLYVSEYERGIAELDTYILRNMAFVDGMPFHVDPARFVRGSEYTVPQRMEQELKDKTIAFRQWLDKNHPTLVYALDTTIQNSVRCQ